jgi:hypothetical protein
MRLDGRFMKIHALNKKGSKTNWDKWNLEGYPTVAFIDRNRNIYFVDNRDIQDPVNGRKTFRPADLEAQAAQIKAQLSGLKTVEQADKLLRTVPRNPKLAMLLMDALLKASVTHPKPEVRIFLEEICKTAADLARRTSGESQKGEKKYMTELSQRLQSEDRKIRLAATLVYMSFPEFAKGIPNEEDLKLIYRNASDSEDAQLAFVSKVAMRAFYKYAEENSFLFRPNKIPPLTEEQKKTFMADVLAAPWTYVRQHGLDVLKQSPEIVPHHVDVLFSYLNDPRTNQLQEAIDLLVGLSKTDAALQKRLLALLRHSKFKDDRLQIMLAEKLVDAGAKVDWQPFLKHKNEMIRLEALIYLSLRGEATPEIKAGWMDFTDQTKKFNPLPYVALAIVASGDKLQDFALQRFKDLASQSPQDYEKNFAGFIETLEFLQNPQVKGEVPEHLLKTSPVLVPALVAVLIKNVENMDAVFSQDASAALNLWTMLAGEEISKKLKELSESDQLSAVQRHIAFGIAAPLLLLEESNTAKVAAKLVYLKQNFDQYLQWLEHPNGFYQMAAFMAIFTVIQQNAEAEIKKVLRIIQNPNSNLRLRLLLKNSFRFRPQDDPYQIAAKQGLKEIAPTQLTAALKSDNEELIDFALVHLGSFPDKAILYKEELFALVEHPKEEIRERAILVLINIEDEAIRLRLEKRLKNNLAKLKNTLPTEENEKLKTKEYELLYGLKLKQKHESLYWDLAPTAMALANSNQEALVLGVGVSLSLAYNGGKMMVGTNFNSGYMARKGGEIYAWEKPGSFKFGGWLNIQTMARFNFHKYSRKISGFVDLPAIGLGHLYGDYYNSPFFTLSPGGIGVDFRIGKNSSRFHIQGRPQFYLNKETWLAGGTLSLGFSFF